MLMSLPEFCYCDRTPAAVVLIVMVDVIIGKKLLSLKLVVKTQRSYKRAGLIKRQKSFQGLAMYGHEVFDVLTKGSKVIRNTLFE
jgi:hypothetical protein